MNTGSSRPLMSTSSATQLSLRRQHWWWLAVAALAMIPALAKSEGDVRVLDCAFLYSCNADGLCRRASGQVSFRMQPISLNQEGAGSYTISYGKTRARMRAISRTTPYIWTVGNERDTLLANSGGDFLWHQLKLVPAPHVTIHFMKCSFAE